MAAENKNTTFSNLGKNETDPDLIAKAATNFLFKNARKHAKEHLKKVTILINYMNALKS